jgi:hypothetical protein
VGEALVQAGAEIDALELLARPNRTRMVVFESDFLCSGAFASVAVPGIYGFALSSGTSVGQWGSKEHPGLVNIYDSTTANGGFRYMCEDVGLLISGGESTMMIANDFNERTTAKTRFGFHDSLTINGAVVDGAWLEIVGDGTNAVISGKTSNNSTVSTTATTYTITSPPTWYRLSVEVNANATLVTFSLINSSTGAVVWTDTLATNIPTARVTGWGLIAGETTTDAAAILCSVDYINFIMNRTLVR